MNNDNVEFMRAMWNMHPFGSSMPQFLRLPPRIANPLVPGHRGYSEGDLAEDATAKIKGFRDAFIHSASNLMGSDEHGLSLPGHQAYARGDKLESLHSKNQMLEKEIIELDKWNFARMNSTLSLFIILWVFSGYFCFMLPKWLFLYIKK